MRIAVNVRLLIDGQLDGIGWFSFHTMKYWAEKHPEHDFLFLFDRKPSSVFRFGDNVHFYTLFPQARHPYLWKIYFDWVMPMYLKKLKADVLVSTDGYIPQNLKIPILNVIHDLNFEHSKDYIKNRMHYNYFRKMFPRFAAKSTRLATVSEFSREDLEIFYGIDPQKVDVVYNGADTCFQPQTEEKKKKTREKYAHGFSYFVYVGALQSRKNIANLFKAFDTFRDTYKEEMKLVMVGKAKFWRNEKELTNAFASMKYKKDVIFTSYLSTKETNAVVSASEALVFPSFFEGFGIPILEAFYAETAVITSPNSAIPEIAGDAALYINPRSVLSIAEGMQRIVEDRSYRTKLIEIGKLQRQKFSWDKTAEALWGSLEKIMQLKQNE